MYDYELRRHPQAKRLKMRLKPDGTLWVSSPRWVPRWSLDAWVKTQSAWIEKTRARQTSIVQEFDITHGSRIGLWGSSAYELIIDRRADKNEWLIKDAHLHLRLKPDPKDQKVALRKLLLDFYQAQARDYLIDRSKHFAGKLGMSFKGLRIKNTKSRWGSCSSQKNLNYNWRIVLAPKEVVDYLVIHEVCHLVHMNHSRAFWDLVATLDPDFKKHQAWLKEHQHYCLNFLA